MSFVKKNCENKETELPSLDIQLILRTNKYTEKKLVGLVVFYPMLTCHTRWSCALPCHSALQFSILGDEKEQRER